MDGYEAGAVEFLSKPIKAKEVLDRVKTLLWLDRFPVEEDSETYPERSQRVGRWESEQPLIPQGN
jgi:DNA-binding response OmpR family regulator